MSARDIDAIEAVLARTVEGFRPPTASAAAEATGTDWAAITRTLH
jgi:hypothetical protein